MSQTVAIDFFFLFEHAVFMHKMFFRSIRYRYWQKNRKFVSESVAAVEAVQSRRDMTVSRRDRTVSRRDRTVSRRDRTVSRR